MSSIILPGVTFAGRGFIIKAFAKSVDPSIHNMRRACEVGHNTASVKTIAAVSGSKKNLISESSDLLYHLLVLWKATGISTRDVWAELDARFDMSGIEEKDARDST